MKARFCDESITGTFFNYSLPFVPVSFSLALVLRILPFGLFRGEQTGHPMQSRQREKLVVPLFWQAADKALHLHSSLVPGLGIGICHTAGILGSHAYASGVGVLAWIKDFKAMGVWAVWEEVGTA